MSFTTFLVILGCVTALGILSIPATRVWHERKGREFFFRPYREFMAETPEALARFVAQLAQKTGLPRAAKTYPVQPERLTKAARAFEEAAREVFGVNLSCENRDARQLDHFANTCLIDERLRPFFRGAKERDDLSEREEEALAEAMAQARVPNEPLLYYCMGAFWGEWLVRYCDAVWALREPLRPIQSFPDMLTADGTVCIHVFSQVNKKLGDPADDQLAFKARVLHSDKRSFGPFPLTSTLAGAASAAASLLPEEARRASKRENAKDYAGALKLYEQALGKDPNNVRLLFLASEAARQCNALGKTAHFLRAALQLAPDHARLNHNLAVVYLQSAQNEQALDTAIGLLERALASDPHYSRARITLASCLMDKGRKDEALEHARWVAEHDPQLRDEAGELIAAIQEWERR